MTLLVFDTATPATVVALVRPDGTAAQARHDPEPGERPGHVEQLLPLAQGLLDRAGLSFGDLDRIAVGTGPGTFTGLRIGVATARALAQAAGAELVGVSSLLTLAAGAGEDRVVAVLDARRGEAFVGVYEHGEAVVAPAAVTPETLARVARAGWLTVGDGAVRFREVLESSGARVPADGSPLHQISALALAQLAAGTPAGDPSAGESVVPEYLRLPDAELALRSKRRE